MHLSGRKDIILLWRYRQLLVVPITLNKSTRSHNVGHVSMYVCVCVCVCVCVYVCARACVGFTQERFPNFSNNRFLKRRNRQKNLVSNEELHR